MKTSKKIFIIIIALFVFDLNSYSQTNEVENKFLKAGLIDARAIDKSIKVDLVNSDPDKNYFRENFYNGLKWGRATLTFCKKSRKYEILP